ncbi:fatty-acyl-CoA synthase [Deinobacterium chartae]|uniref:Fatty-acyl-CoA synthase n=1 Tax=Deinobacterium chartae TaxID=521158 RepID=A0A841I3P7_9DEIO|nr:long-chain fatty acid--CoA ligase [Deinobacterium chartae]MBB6098949.1 fatty-acyl-CoA synthase [Deinobacterium chartae]
MRSTMMDVQLTVSTILERVGTLFAQQEVVSLLPAGMDEAGRPIPAKHRCTYGDVYRRAKQLAHALTDAGIRPGDRVATLATNHFRHLEAYLGIPITGAVLHTVNVRLHPEQIVYIINHAGDRILLLDNVFARMIPQIVQACPQLEKIVVMGPLPQAVPGVVDYDAWIGGYGSDYRYPELDERDACGMCYTSGTTGNPKGVLYSHRSTVLHSLASALPDALDLREADRLLPVVPMFHVNAWGLPYTAAMVGASQVFASVFSDGASLARLMQEEKVTLSAGVPTIWMGLLQELERAQVEGQPYDLSAMRKMVVGGSAAPEALIRAFDRLGLYLGHAWGMTETSPLGTNSQLPPGVDERSDEGYRLRAKQGRAVPLVELKLVNADLEEVPHDGQTMGNLLIRGPWISESYFGDPEASRAAVHSIEGRAWFDTGDIATMDERGYMHIKDRAKELIKSGGEWISSVDLENALMGHPAVAEAAVIAVPHPRWTERPLAVVVKRPGAEVSAEELTAYLEPHFARFWLPDAYEFVAEIPRTAAGKFLKRKLREQFQGYTLPV